MLGMKLGFLLRMPKLTFDIPEHDHPCYEFHYVVSGSGSFRSGNRRFPIRRGDFFYNEPGVRHQAMVTGRKAMLLQYAVGLFLDPAKDRQLIADLKKRLPEAKRRRLGDGYYLFFEQLRRQHSSGQPELIHAALFSFVGLLYKIMGGDTDMRSSNSVVEESLGLIHARITKGVSLEELADRFGLSRSYFIRLFKRHVGISPVKYLNNLRMEMASELLRESELTLAEIAQRTGFSDESQFSKRFKQWSGKPPGRFRQSHSHD
jgi:AraC-like DNA-binding protein